MDGQAKVVDFSKEVVKQSSEWPKLAQDTRTKLFLHALAILTEEYFDALEVGDERMAEQIAISFVGTAAFTLDCAHTLFEKELGENSSAYALKMISTLRQAAAAC